MQSSDIGLLNSHFPPTVVYYGVSFWCVNVDRSNPLYPSVVQMRNGLLFDRKSNTLNQSVFIYIIGMIFIGFNLLCHKF